MLVKHRARAGPPRHVVVNEPSLLFYPRPLMHDFHNAPSEGSDFICATLEFEGGASHALAHALPAMVGERPRTGKPNWTSRSLLCWSMDSWHVGFALRPAASVCHRTDAAREMHEAIAGSDIRRRNRVVSPMVAHRQLTGHGPIRMRASYADESAATTALWSRTRGHHSKGTHHDRRTYHRNQQREQCQLPGSHRPGCCTRQQDAEECQERMLAGCRPGWPDARCASQSSGISGSRSRTAMAHALRANRRPWRAERPHRIVQATACVASRCRHTKMHGVPATSMSGSTSRQQPARRHDGRLYRLRCTRRPGAVWRAFRGNPCSVPIGSTGGLHRIASSAS